MSYKAIIWDFFGVINTDTGTLWVKNNVPNVDTQLLLRGMFPRVDVGEIHESEFFEIASKIVGRPSDAVRNEWFELSAVNASVVNIITELKPRLKMVLCTNAPHELVTDILVHLGIYHLFDHIFISSDLKLIKPSPEIFNHVLKEAGIVSEEAIFVDDSARNVEGAERIGIKSLLYKDAEQLGEDLHALL
jgi:HAD superfamily hydrolase (TIGR01509 family)